MSGCSYSLELQCSGLGYSIFNLLDPHAHLGPGVCGWWVGSLNINWLIATVTRWTCPASCACPLDLSPGLAVFVRLDRRPRPRGGGCRAQHHPRSRPATHVFFPSCHCQESADAGVWWHPRLLYDIISPAMCTALNKNSAPSNVQFLNVVFKHDPSWMHSVLQ